MGRINIFTSQQNSANTILLTSVHTFSSVFVTFYQGRMSAEAADRVAAVASSRPSTPLQTSWFEFLLDGSLLEKHLQKTNPGAVFHVFHRYHCTVPLCTVLYTATGYFETIVG